jgi:hypothetical protein
MRKYSTLIIATIAWMVSTRFTVREFPWMNHGFQTVPPDHTPGKASDGETTSPLVLQTISDWIIAQAGTTMGTAM